MDLGSTVTLVYTGKLEDGTVFGYATEENPMVFQTGMDMAIDGFEKEILAMEGVEGDRQRSLRQEIAEIEPAAIAPFEGQAQVLREAGEAAAQLLALGAAADDLIKPSGVPNRFSGVDESA